MQSTSTGGRFRRRRVNFATVSNSALQDPKLSLRAKGLYALIQSYINIPSFDLYKGFLTSNCVEGEKAFDSAWKELKEKGYLKQYRLPGKNRGHWVYEYELLEIADLSSLSTVTLNKDGEQTEKTDAPKETPAPEVEKTAPERDSDHTPQKGGYGQIPGENSPDHTPLSAPGGRSTVCSEHPVLKGGDINNIYLNNTDLNKIKSIRQSEGPDGRNDLRERLKEQIEYDYFAENYPEDLKGIGILLDCMVEMLSSPTTRINGYPQERDTLKAYIGKADSIVVREFLEHMRKQPMKDVTNITAYWRSSFINYLRDRELAEMTV